MSYDLKYRPEVDGLRALAVIPVILFHAGFEWISGGYIGVDVFFVISGYLITSIIVSEKQVGKFSVARFYERRARRILPALFLVMLLCLPFAWFGMLPNQQKEFSDSLIAVAIFVSNMLFMQEMNYFATASELKPLLHTWSLAVEEQYYVLFPLFIVIFWRFGKTFLVGALVLFLALGLLWAQAGGNFNLSAPHMNEVWDWWDSPNGAFFLAPTRAWAILIGALIAFFSYTQSGRVIMSGTLAVNQWGSIAGIALISYAMFLFNKYTPYPSIYTLVPTVGAGLLILFATPNTWVGKVLAHRWIVGIGLISYSAYLWHQPMFAFARLYSHDEPSQIVYITLSFLSLGLAYLAWRFVEKPFRDRNLFTRRTIFMSAMIGSIFFIVVGFAGRVTKGFESRYAPEVLAALTPSQTNHGVGCALRNIDVRHASLHVCEFGDTSAKYSLALYGDSHAGALFTELDKTLREKGIKGLRLYNSLCEPIPQVRVEENGKKPDINSLSKCLEAHEVLMAYAAKEAYGIIVVIRWTYRLYPISGFIEKSTYDNGEGGVEPGSTRNRYLTAKGGVFDEGGDGKRRAIHDFVTGLTVTGKKILLIYPIPSAGWHIPEFNLKSLRSWEGKIPETITTSYTRHKEYNRFVENALDSIGERPNLTRIKPETVLCNTSFAHRCLAQVNGVPLYYDSNHLSNAGARLVVDEIMRHVGK